MHDVNLADFVDFFQSLWGKDRKPFAWQEALAKRVIQNDEGPWPQAIALPTAAGKTACMDIAVFSLAAQAGRLDNGKALTAPRRIFFVVDRRVIVDEAFERGRLLSQKLTEAKGGILKEVADRLRRLAGGPLPLAAFQLRGGILRSDAWAKSPTQPLIVAGTVDQIGSRLLFRAYGPGHGMRPIHAALVGNDSLILLDEAHCAQPFLETLQAVARYRSWAESTLPSPFHVTIMSATPPAGLETFLDLSDEGQDPRHPLGQRQLAAKPAKLVTAKKAKGNDVARINSELANELVNQALALAKDWSGLETGTEPAVVLFCNRVDTARRAYNKLIECGEDATLLTGRMRPIDKDDTVAEALAELAAENSRQRRLKQPRYVVATQTLEVGANLDFDLLVTECASLDALRQRFGRLNRMGRPILARAVIVARADQVERKGSDPVYGEALTATWQWLTHKAEDDIIDFGIVKLAQILPSPKELANLNAPSSHAPVLLPAHVDTLAQTDPEPWPSPDVALFLHGPNSGPADVQVCWRADLNGDETLWNEVLTRCPPVTPECLNVPIGQMRRWLAGLRGDGGTDLEGQPETEDLHVSEKQGERIAVRWLGRKQMEVVRDPGKLRPGDVLVIPSRLGGWEELGTLGSSPFPDWADRAYAMVRDRAILRLHPEVLRQWPKSEILLTLAESGSARLNGEDPDAIVDELKDALRDWITRLQEPKWSWLKTQVDNLAADKKLARNVFPHPTGGLFVIGSQRLNLYEMNSTPFSDEDDESSSGCSRAWLLSEGDRQGHLDGVAQIAARNARLCGLPKELVEVLRTAGRGHDLGKADPRFQAWLKGGNPWVRGPLLAKSNEMAQSLKESRKAREQAKYPIGGRHELLSVRMLESMSKALPQDHALRDLVLHLVESHHGHSRPFAPVVKDPEPVQVKLEIDGCLYTASSATGLEHMDGGPAERYWHLTHRYGWWGLAWLETMLRLADHCRSEWEERHAKGGD